MGVAVRLEDIALREVEQQLLLLVGEDRGARLARMEGMGEIGEPPALNSSAEEIP